jgi:DNA-binding response OmpR family regulator
MADDTAPLIFILDDDTDAAEIFRDQLALIGGVEIRTFADFDSMAAAEEVEAVDLFVVDVKLGGPLSGFEVPGALPARCRFAAFLFISGFALDDDQYSKVAGLAFFDFIAKPFTTSIFIHRVKLLLAARLRIPGQTNPRVIEQWTRAPFVAAVCGDDYRIKLCNRQLAAALEVESPRDLVGRVWFDFFVRADDAETFKRIYAAVVAGQVVRYGEHITRLRGAGGGSIIINWCHSAFQGPAGDDLLLSVGMPSGYKIKMAAELRQAWRESIERHQAAIKAIKRRPLHIAEVPACTMEGNP